VAAGCGGDGEDKTPDPPATPTPFVDPASSGWRRLRSLERLDAPQAGRARLVSSASPDPRSNEDYNNYLRQEGRNTYVLAEHQGPGVLTRLWMTARVPSGSDSVPGFHRAAVLGVTVDGVLLFSVPLHRFFAGELPPFQAPLVRQHRSRSGPDGLGFYSYVPISFAASLKVTLSDPLAEGAEFPMDRLFYQINVLDLGGQEAVEPSPMRRTDGTLALSAEDESARQEVVAQWSDPAGSAGRWLDQARQRVAFPGPIAGSPVIAELTGPGRIRGLRLSTGAVRPDALERVRLRIFWDEEAEPSVDVPLGTAWGNHFSRTRFLSLAQGATLDGQWYLALPMPFRQAARVELVNSGPAQPIACEVLWDPQPVRSDSRYLHARFVEATVEAEQRLEVASAAGAGHLVGVRVVVDVREDGNVLEGDERIAADGVPTHRGTGTEDFFNAHWFFEGGVRSAPLHGATSVEGRREQLDIDAYRFLLPDLVPFGASLRFELENANRRGHRDDYRAVAFYYLAR
jgi:hypothetical protein